MKSIPICDAVQKVRLLIQHQFVALIQHWQQLSPCALPLAHVLSFKFHYPGNKGHPAGRARATVGLWELYNVFPVLKSTQLNNKEQIIARGICCRLLNLWSLLSVNYIKPK